MIKKEIKNLKALLEYVVKESENFKDSNILAVRYLLVFIDSLDNFYRLDIY